VEQGAAADVSRAPSLVFAVLGQAKADGGLSPEDEGNLLAKLLTFWAMRSTLDSSAYCAAIPRSQVRAVNNLDHIGDTTMAKQRRPRPITIDDNGMAIFRLLQSSS